MNEIIGTSGDDVLVGTSADDVITGDAGNDQIDGGAGNDIIDSGFGDDTVTGGTGNDQINGGPQSDIINGTDSNAAGAGEVDTLTGSSKGDLFILGDETQPYYVTAGDGDYALITDFKLQDTIQLNGLPSNYSLTQVDTDTHILLENELVAILANVNAADLNLNASYFSYVGASIIGTDGDDVLEGTSEGDIILGGSGNDIINGGPGVDNLNGEDGNDTIDGGEGNDIINGGNNNDTIDGGSGDDTIDGGGGDDSITGGAGNDEIIGGSQQDTLNGTDSNAAGAGEVDNLTGGSKNDLFILGDENQAYYVAAGDEDYAFIADFNITQDTLQLNGLPNDYSLNQVDADTHIVRVEDGELVAILANTTATDLDPNASYFSYVGASIIGTDGDDVLDGTDEGDIILGGSGNDIINGGPGIDNLDGEDGNDIIDGGEGNDIINGGNSNDTIDGGAGDDTIDGGGGEDSITGGAGNDDIIGGSQKDSLNGTDSTAAGAGEIDNLTGGSKSDLFILGDENQAYYVAAGDADYVRINDFNPTQDTIQLNGLSSSYNLSQIGTDTHIARAQDGELIAILANTTATDLDLSATYFTYVGAVPNTPPTAVLDEFSTDEDIALTISANDLLNNDIDPDVSDTLQIIEVSNASNGTTALDTNGNIIFTPEQDFNGEASFDYTISDGEENSTTTVSVLVNPINDSPTALEDEITTDEDIAVTIAAADLLSNDIDPDLSDTLQIVEVSNASNGTVALDTSGNITFTPDQDFNGKASFDYAVSDGSDTSTASVSVLVNSVNDAPTTTGINGFTVTDNAPDTVIDLFSVFNDAEDDDTELTFEIVNNTDTSLFHSVEIDESAGTLVLDYAWGAHGISELTLRATDTEGASVDTTFSVTALNATIFRDHLTGGEGDDYLNGGFGRDSLFGANGNDIILGGAGSDYLNGGEGDDLLDGTGKFTTGLLERDALFGGKGSDTFVLGNSHEAYYTGFYFWDYAVIKDFNAQEDTLQLHGAMDEYRTVSSHGNTYLYNETNSHWCSTFDLVAVFKDNASIDLGSSAVEFLS